MHRRWVLRARVAGTVLASTVAGAGCGENTVKAHGAERSVADVVARQSGFRATDVRCPSGVEAKVGAAFDCHFTGPEPADYVANVRITAVDGTKVVFFVRSRPARSS